MSETLVLRNGDFLVRDSLTNAGDYVLTCRWDNEVLHFKIGKVLFKSKETKVPGTSLKTPKYDLLCSSSLLNFFSRCLISRLFSRSLIWLCFLKTAEFNLLQSLYSLYYYYLIPSSIVDCLLAADFNFAWGTYSPVQLCSPSHKHWCLQGCVLDKSAVETSPSPSSYLCFAHRWDELTHARWSIFTRCSSFCDLG